MTDEDEAEIARLRNRLYALTARRSEEPRIPWSKRHRSYGFSLPNHLADKLDRLAAAAGLPNGRWVREMIIALLEGEP